MNKLTAFMAGAALLALAAPASAQVVGGLGGNVGGGVSVNTGGVTGAMRDTVGSTRDLARDTMDTARATSNEARGSTASTTGSMTGAADADRDGLSVDLDASVGADFHSAGGESLGRFVGTQMTNGERWAIIQGADGVYRGVPAGQLTRGTDGALTSPLSAYEFRRQPELSGGDRGVQDNSRPERGETPDDSVN